MFIGEKPILISLMCPMGKARWCAISSIYLDTLMISLKNTGVGCFWGGQFAGALAYEDDIVLMAPSFSAIRLMLLCCELFATSHGLLFNPIKTQFIQFSQSFTFEN